MKTYGTLKFLPRDKAWVVEAQPHVVLRLKRVFAQISKASQGLHVLSANPENARDLCWFLERYPLAMSALERSYLENQARKHEERVTLVEQLVKGMIKPRPFDMALPARDYQRVAAETVLSTGGLLLADELGVGKTVSGIAMLTDPRTRPALVVTLTHLPKQWVDELSRFAPQLTTHIVKSTTPYDLTSTRKRGVNGNGHQAPLPGTFPDVIIMNYHKLHGWAETLSGVIRSIILDETQELRTGEGTGKYAAARQIAGNADFRLGLSGTPIYNYGGEFYNVLDCLKPGALGTRSEFIEEWCTGGEGNKPAIKDPKAFGSYLKDNGYMLLRTRADVGREIPPLTTIPHYIDADMNALNDVSRSCAELARIILRQGESKQGEKMLASDEFNLKLRQATGVAKAPFVADFVRLLVEQGESVVLAGWHRSVYSVWLDKLKDLKPAMFTGSETAKQKEEAKQRFVKRETPVFILSNRAGVGLDGLQYACRTIVHGELDYSPAVHNQIDGRVARDGQPDPVSAYYLISEVGSDPVIADILGIKTHQLSGVLHPEQALVEKLQVDTKDRMKRLAESYLAQLNKSR
jgi:SNF2 family DNA or RNA helicase